MFEHEKIVVDASYCPNFGCFASFVPCSVPLVWSNPVSMCLESDVWLSDVGTSVICGFQSDASTPRWSNTKLQEKCTVCVYTYFSKHFSHIPYFTKTENMVYFRAMSKKKHMSIFIWCFSPPLWTIRSSDWIMKPQTFGLENLPCLLGDAECTTQFKFQNKWQWVHLPQRRVKIPRMFETTT